MKSLPRAASSVQDPADGPVRFPACILALYPPPPAVPILATIAVAGPPPIAGPDRTASRKAVRP